MSEPTWARKKAAEIVGSVYWRGGAHPSAKEFLLVERIAAALVKERARKPAPHMKLSQRDAKTFVEAAMSEHKHTFPVDAACDCGAMISEVCHDLQRQLAEAQAALRAAKNLLRQRITDVVTLHQFNVWESEHAAAIRAAEGAKEEKKRDDDEVD